jgi:hypothetical protein
MKENLVRRDPNKVYPQGKGWPGATCSDCSKDVSHGFIYKEKDPEIRWCLDCALKDR